MNKRLIANWYRYFTAFLQMMSRNSHLISVKFKFSPYFFANIDTPPHDVMYRAIVDFLGSQHYLKRTEFHHCYFRFPEGVELLRKLIENTSESLTRLVLREFVRSELLDREQDSNILQNLHMLLPSLTEAAVA
ncbi:hypothetical protein AVEN_67761-1 [Araneus ventricosus]|uniref:Uncharacterized protein n=1 Tax=Araneus ventricosus TaxID=182803 RepID=A0A4Y2URI4_ARAVE|nr:hypothetical protein AVEN_67761-1 [Araneus ventricosus]